MSPFAAADQILHSALVPGSAVSLDEAAITDRQRLGILLQGAALLSHLEHGGWHLESRWDEARITADGQLTNCRGREGRHRRLCQDLLTDLALRLFLSRQVVAGRGAARKAVRTLLDHWRQSLSPLSPDRAVAQVLEAAPFLWGEEFGVVRRSLVAEHFRDGRSHLWIAGPGEGRRRILDRVRRRRDVDRALASLEARELWEGREDEPLAHARAGRWRAAVTAWERRGDLSPQERLSYARALFALGKFDQALSSLRKLTATPHRILRVACQQQLGRLGAARASLRRLETAALTPQDTVDLAETAVRVLANSGDEAGIARWVKKVLQLPQDEVGVQARLVAASAAWDLGDTEQIEDLLPAQEEVERRLELVWRYHQIRGLQAMAAADGPAMVRHLRQALGQTRRHLRKFEAGRLWNDLAVGRVQAGDLAGAERALCHALDLLRDCEGPARTTLVLANLAEVRIRRGRFSGVQEILETTCRENRLASNTRGSAQDTELEARYELARGQVQTALSRCQTALRESGPTAWNRAELQVLAGRALGWLGRAEEAARALAETTARAQAQLEPEERPALWALAGNEEEAARAARESGFPELWQRVLAGEPPRQRHWDEVQALEAFRAARLVYDCEKVSFGSTPLEWRHRAADTLRRCQAVALAEHLESALAGPWKALEHYLARPPGEPGSLADLFAAAGHPTARLVWRSPTTQEELIPGAGGEEEVSAPLAGGRLILSAPVLDEVTSCLFRLALRDVVPRQLVPHHRGGNGILGESPTLRRALHRLAKLARRDVPVLILGETGTGKELAAREVHRASTRSKGPFIPLNCAALSEHLLLSDLFGHTRGAFTGADRDRSGVFETARGGTVFLDEIGDLPLHAQGMLLRVLQEGEVRRLGESHPRHVDVRVVAATHRDLQLMVERDEFRHDLYFRLRVAQIQLPPLRDRGSDVIHLAEHFLLQGQGPTARLSEDARSRLLAHRWPGNVRELKNVLEVARALCAQEEGATIRGEHLDLSPSRQNVTSGYHQEVESFRRRLVMQALESSGGNQSEAARRLGLTRQALSYLVRQLKIA